MNKRFLFLFFISICLVIYIYFNTKILFFADLISIIDLLFLFYFYFKFKVFRHIIFNIYLTYHILTVILPLIIISVFYKSSLIKEYLHHYYLNSKILIYTNLIIFLYDTVLVLSIIGFSNVWKKFSFINNARFIKYYIFEKEHSLYLTLILLYLISLISKIYLIDIKVWFMYEQVDTTKYSFLGIIKVLSNLDILVFFYFVYKQWHDKLKLHDIVFLSIFFFISLILAIISTSKAKIFLVLIPLFLIILHSKSKLKFFYIITIFIFLIKINFLFNLMIYMRLHPNVSIYQAVIRVDHIEERMKNVSINSNLVLKRLNYQVPIAKVIQKYGLIPNEIKFDYIQNLTGLIPRFLFPWKSRMGINYNKLGKEIGLINKNDYVTSVGITPIGEAVYEGGIFYIIFVPIIVGLLMSFFMTLLNTKYWIGFILSIFLGFSFALPDSYVLLLPSIIKIFIIFFILGILLSQKFLYDNIKLKIKI